MEAQLLTRETKVREQSVTLFSIDGARWDSDSQRLQQWHRNRARGPAWSWGDQQARCKRQPAQRTGGTKKAAHKAPRHRNRIVD